MNQEFLELYDRELKLLYERGKEFAQEYPEMAGRLGNLTEEHVDPLIGGLLEGAAFMAARVQQKLKSEFGQFTVELIEQLMPGILAPTPSFALVQARPDLSNPALLAGLKLPAGSYLDAEFMESNQRVVCRYRMADSLTLWPYQISKAEYFGSAAALQSRGLAAAPSTAAGMAIELSLAGDDAQPGGKTNGFKVNMSTPDVLPVYLLSPASDAGLLYEQLFSKLRRLSICYRDEFGDARILPLPSQAIEPVGFEPHTSLFGYDDRLFSGFNHLREFFAFPAKYLGFRLAGLKQHLARIAGDRFEIVFEFDSVVPRLISVVNRDAFGLYVVAAANLSEVVCAPLQIRTDEHEQAVIVDRSRPLNHEVYRILDVAAQFPRSKERVQVYPLYSAASNNLKLSTALFYSSRRLDRRKTDKERRAGLSNTYLGTETFLSLKEPAEAVEAEPVRTLQIRALVTNRHLAERLTAARGRIRFKLLDNTTIPFESVAGPTPPRESILLGLQRGKSAETVGSMLWKLISFLQFNHIGLALRSNKDSASALRELLMLFADVGNPTIERRIRGITDVSTRPLVRKIQQENGFNVARGMEVTVTFDEAAFEGQGVFLFGTVLKNFLSEYASLNSFTETVIVSKQRQLIKRWEHVIGQRSLI
jgi:type VI secretion system protein ImpG